jgi:hypothetical protein
VVVVNLVTIAARPARTRRGLTAQAHGTARRLPPLSRTAG